MSSVLVPEQKFYRFDVGFPAAPPPAEAIAKDRQSEFQLEVDLGAPDDDDIAAGADEANLVISQLRASLERNPHFRGRSRLVRARFRQGVLRLAGQLPTWYLKQVLQNVASQISQVKRIVNRVSVYETVLGNGS